MPSRRDLVLGSILVALTSLTAVELAWLLKIERQIRGADRDLRERDLGFPERMEKVASRSQREFLREDMSISRVRALAEENGRAVW